MVKHDNPELAKKEKQFVDELRLDAPVRAEDDEARPLRGAGDRAPQPAMPAQEAGILLPGNPTPVSGLMIVCSVP